MTNFTISVDELRRALELVEEAIGRGFMSSMVTLEIDRLDSMNGLVLKYEDIIVKAHPSDDRFNWGRAGMDFVRSHRFNGEKLITERKRS